MYDIHIQNAGYVQGKAIIEQLSFSLPQHAIVGLIGGNGAGKSTTIQAIMHTLPYADVTHQLPTYYGYVPERPILYEYYTLREHIQLLVHTMDEEAEHLWARALQLCDTFRLTQHLDDYPIQFSKGMQQKVMLVLAFTPKHLFYIIDEPFMGLDPQAIRALLTLLKARRLDGATILLSTHALDTAERLCDTFLCMDQGRLIAQGTLQALRERDETLLDVFDRLMEEARIS